jgi:protein TonB
MSDLTLAQRRVEQLEQETRKMLVQQKASTSVNTCARAAAGTNAHRYAGNADAADIVQRSLNIAQLQARISRDIIAYQERPRRAFMVHARRSTGVRALRTKIGA